MASGLPPLEQLPIFDNSQFLHNTEGLTFASASKLFLQFPTAQGTENLLNTNINGQLVVEGQLNVSGASFITQLEVETQALVKGDMTCLGTINYTTLNPPITGGGENIQQTLTAGNDCGQLNILNAGSLSINTTGTIVPLKTFDSVAGPTLLIGNALAPMSLQASNIQVLDNTGAIGYILPVTGGGVQIGGDIGVSLLKCSNLQSEVIDFNQAVIGITPNTTTISSQTIDGQIYVSTARLACPNVVPGTGLTGIHIDGDITTPSVDATVSLKAPIHYVGDTHNITTNNSGLVFDAPVVEAVVVSSVSTIASGGVFTSNLNPLENTTDILVNGNLDLNNNDITCDTSNFKTSNLNNSDKSQQFITTYIDSSPFEPGIPEIQISCTESPYAYLHVPNFKSDNTISSQGIFVFDSAFATAGTIVSNNNFTLFNDAGVDRVLWMQGPQNQIISETGANISGFHEISCVVSKSQKIRDINLSTGTANQILSNNSSGNLDWIDATPTPTLAQVMTAGATASSDLDMSNYDVNNINSIRGQQGQLEIRSKLNMNNEIDMKAYRITLSNGYDGFSRFDSSNDGSSILTLDGGGIQLKKYANFTAYNNSNDAVIQTDSFNNNLKSFTDCKLVDFGTINGVDIKYNPTQTYYVSKSGSNTGLGSILSPFLTIQKAIDVISVFTDGLPKVINILQGDYVENITISKSRISFVGTNPSAKADLGCSITGTITINCTMDNTDLHNNNIFFNNMLIDGSITNTSTTQNRLSLANCYIYGNSQLVHMNNSVDYRFFANNCNFVNESTVSTDEMLLFNGSGMSSLTNCQFTQKALGNVIHFNDSSRIDIFANNYLTNSNSSLNVQAILKLSSNTTKAIGNSAFIYSSSSIKSTVSPNFSCGILMNTPASSNSVLSLINNIFSLAGCTGQGAFAVNQVNANSSIILFGGNISTSSNLGITASAIVGTLNVSKFSTTICQ